MSLGPFRASADPLAVLSAPVAVVERRQQSAAMRICSKMSCASRRRQVRKYFLRDTECQYLHRGRSPRRDEGGSVGSVVVEDKVNGEETTGAAGRVLWRSRSLTCFCAEPFLIVFPPLCAVPRKAQALGTMNAIYTPFPGALRCLERERGRLDLARRTLRALCGAWHRAR